MEQDYDTSPLHRPQLMLIALRCAAKGPVRADECLKSLKTRLGKLSEGLPEDGALCEEIAHAYQELAMATLVDPVGDGRFAITPRGEALLATHPQGIDGSVLENYAEYRDYISAIARPRSAPEGVDNDGVVHEPELAYLDGLASYQRGFDLTDNPYDSDSVAHLEWSNGWSDAEGEVDRREALRRPPSDRIS